ncbi:MAG: glycosyltransferase family 39 protein [Nanoarchaeota archaeon]
MDEKINEEILDKNNKYEKWMRDPHNLLFALLIIFTIGIRLYYFSMTANQPIWWDEGDYLALAKEFAIPAPETPEWWTHFANIRPLFMSFVWAVFIKFGISEAVMRFMTEVIPSILLVVYSYLLASSLFNKKIGLVTGYFTSIYWVILFYGARFMTDIPAMFFAVASAYYFWEYYLKREKAWGLYICIILGVIGFMTRFPTALVTFGILFYLLLIKKHKFFLDKKIWIAGLCGIATLFPYFLFNKIKYGDWFPAAAFYGKENVTVYKSPAWLLIKYIPEFLTWPITIILLAGLAYSIFKMIIGADVFWKQKSNQINADYFVFIWIALHIYYYVFSIKTGNDRWILLWMPPLFMYLGIGIEKIGKILKNYLPYAGIILFALIFVFAGNVQIKHADQLTKVKLDSYQEVKDSALWLKENTPPETKVMGASVVQNVYYSHRRNYDFGIGNEVPEHTTTKRDPQGRLIDSTYNFPRNETEVECKMVRIKPDYMIVHVFEPEFTPPFMYDYPQRNMNILTPVKAFQRQGQTTAVIYKFNGYPEINESRVNCTAVYERPEFFSNLTLDKKDPHRYKIPS